MENSARIEELKTRKTSVLEPNENDIKVDLIETYE
jgi:hypothetical protein